MRPYVICHMMASLDCPSTLEGKTMLLKHYAQNGAFQPKVVRSSMIRTIKVSPSV